MKNIILLFVLVVTLSGCGGYSMVSRQIENPVIIDGNSEDWNWKLKYFEKEHMAVGISEDADNLYICLATADRANIMKILRFGLTIWLEPGNSKGEAIGIQYPIKSVSDEARRLIDPLYQRKNKDIVRELIEKVKMTQSEYLVINEDDFPLGAYSLKNEKGAELAIGYDSGKLVYEIKIPKKSKDYFPINLTGTGDNELTVSIKSEVPVVLGMKGSPTQNRMTGRNGGMGRGKGMGRRNLNQDGLNGPIDFEINVKFNKN